MPHHTTPTPNDKGASYNDSTPPLSTLQTQLAKHQTFHERVKAINSALRKARIEPAAEDAYARSREVLLSVLENERLVEMYLRQLWQVVPRRGISADGIPRRGHYVAFPSSVLVKNGQTIRSIQESLTETQTGQTGAATPARPTTTTYQRRDK
jgi:hypothetical protein